MIRASSSEKPDTLWQRSLCAGPWLHRYKQTRAFPEAVEEICQICKDRQIFKMLTPNREYLSYHLRSALQKSNPRFQKEYARKH